MDKVAKLILNSLKCPVCGGQIDLLDWTKLESKPKDQNFSCVYDPEHFGIFLVHWEQPIRLEQERATVYEGKYQYRVIQYHYFGGVPNCFTNIEIREVDPEHRVKELIPIKEFHYQKHLFDFTKTNKEKLINRIKTILVFQ
jgi:hypothetical protein